MAEIIRIDDLNEPVLTKLQSAALAYGESLTINFERDAILAEARERAGLDDFGASDYLARLDLLCSEWGQDDGLTGIGRLTLRNKLVTFATSRLLIRDFLKRHPEILDTEIVAPIIVAGLPRSGTTHLLNLLASDPRLRSLPLWESYEPLPLPRDQAGVDGLDPRHTRCNDAWGALQATVPLLAAMHPMNPDHIHEELELMGPDFASYNFEWLSMSPRWRDHYYATDQTPHYEYMRDVLKILQSIRGPQRWVLKCPQHLEQLPTLLKVFPNATLVLTRRNPVEVIQSSVTMLAYGQRMNRHKVETKALIEYWSDRVEHILRAAVRDRPNLDEAQTIDVPFKEFMADDMGMIERIYAKTDLELTPEVRARMNQFIADNPRGKHGQVVYNLEQDFGVRPEALQSRFDFY
jgi:hypothetical protein